MTLGTATLLLAIPWKKWTTASTLWIVALLKPLGIWGLLGISAVDSAIFPMVFLDPLTVSYSVGAPSRTLLICFMAALGSAIGALLPFYIGRAGGELFLLKRINRERYERLRDRFEKQEFLAIMIPSMGPPPTPVKILILAAGVFEMRVTTFFLAMLCGKFLRFLIESYLVILYGPAILSNALNLLHRHFNLVLAGLGALLIVLAVYILRKVFNRRRQIPPLPIEEPTGSSTIEDISSPS